MLLRFGAASTSAAGREPTQRALQVWQSPAAATATAGLRSAGVTHSKAGVMRPDSDTERQWKGSGGGVGERQWKSNKRQ